MTIGLVAGALSQRACARDVCVKVCEAARSCGDFVSWSDELDCASQCETQRADAWDEGCANDLEALYECLEDEPCYVGPERRPGCADREYELFRCLVGALPPGD